MRRGVLPVALLAAAISACSGIGTSTPTPSSEPGALHPPHPSAVASSPAGSDGIPVGELGTIDVERLREALLGQPPYPTGWEAQVEELVATVTRLLQEVRVPDVTGLAPADAACAVWEPLVGHTLWATGAFAERQVFVAHLAMLAGVAPDEVRAAAKGALATVAQAAAEQMVPGGDPDVIIRRPTDGIRQIGMWAVAHCDLPVTADEAPDATGWTDEEIAFSCDLDRSGLERGQEDYRAGPGHGLYAEHPHTLEVTLDFFVYPAWHRLAAVDNQAEPPTFRIEPIPGSFCDR